MTKEGKYTILRSKKDIEDLHDVEGILEFYTGKLYTSDSKRYRDLPMVLEVVAGKLQDLQEANEVLTAKAAELDQIRTHVCRIIEISRGKK